MDIKKFASKRIASVIVATATLFTLNVSARDRDIGVGVFFGEPLGLTAKKWLDDRTALGGGLSYSFNDYVLVYADYLTHFPAALSSGDSHLSDVTPYVGGGLVAAFATSDVRGSGRSLNNPNAAAGVGVRIPFGLEWSPRKTRLGVHLEVAPGLGIVPGVYAYLHGGIGVRYYF